MQPPIMETAIGVKAALLSSLSYIPQVRKVWAGRPTDDLSLQTLIALTAELSLWVVCGLSNQIGSISTANLRAYRFCALSQAARLTARNVAEILRNQGGPT
jgi:uncharacterized protein with PQ loop repeat